MEVKNTVSDSSGQQLLTETKTDSYSAIFLYFIQDFLRWWYVRMPIWHLRKLARISVVVNDNLSLSLLVQNFFLPWHRDYSMMGYIFGLLIKVLYIPIALFIYLTSVIIYIIIILIWLLLPVGTLTFIFTSIFR